MVYLIIAAPTIHKISELEVKHFVLLARYIPQSCPCGDVVLLAKYIQ